MAERGAGSALFGLAVSVWSCLHGVVSLECGGSFVAMQLDTDALFDREVEALVARVDASSTGGG
ncbi:TetR-like C-terminal domain-containing protein [Mobilicoccus caccae]|uniref:HTH-type transcriptional regulator MT1864/Rv1816-like C-terminal domain-containing protein n=1 Tax=Mobilicoccus caccae TaxID=1859295 RepID=A0ABQ6IXT8_9MICO|nr:hypothetical protein GCM10025883_40170 [Mobilicoccus caccae]